MAWTQSDVDKLKTTLATHGFVRSLSFGDQTLTFNSMDDMFKLLDRMQQDVTVQESATGSTTRYAVTSKGV